MKYLKPLLISIAIIMLFFFLFPDRIYGYLDAGSGSYIIQIIIGIVIGGAFGIKIFWRRIYNFFKKSSAGEKKGEEPKK